MSEPTEPGQSLSEWAKAYLVDAAGKPLQMLQPYFIKRGPEFTVRDVPGAGWTISSWVNLPEREESTPSYEEYMASVREQETRDRERFTGTGEES